jgi:hypothetical protein
MEGNIERECSALGGLFQQIINDMKVSYDKSICYSSVILTLGEFVFTR